MVCFPGGQSRPSETTAVLVWPHPTLQVRPASHLIWLVKGIKAIGMTGPVAHSKLQIVSL